MDYLVSDIIDIYMSRTSEELKRLVMLVNNEIMEFNVFQVNYFMVMNFLLIKAKVIIV